MLAATALSAGAGLVSGMVGSAIDESLYQKHRSQNLDLLQKDGLPLSLSILGGGSTNRDLQIPKFTSYLGPGGNYTPATIYAPKSEGANTALARANGMRVAAPGANPVKPPSSTATTPVQPPSFVRQVSRGETPATLPSTFVPTRSAGQNAAVSYNAVPPTPALAAQGPNLNLSQPPPTLSTGSVAPHLSGSTLVPNSSASFQLSQMGNVRSEHDRTGLGWNSGYSTEGANANVPRNKFGRAIWSNY